MKELLEEKQLDLRTLFEAGVHFGHPTRKWNPKMDEYIYTKQSKSHVIDLQKTIKQLEKARKLIIDIVSKGGSCMFVGTKLQAHATIREEASRCESYYINRRWLGGVLTNFKTMKTRVDMLKNLETQVENPDDRKHTKRELGVLGTKAKKLKKFFGGLTGIEKIPDLMFVIDTELEINAVREAKKLRVPIVALVDTNCDPSNIDIPIPGNDDAMRSISLITKFVADAVIEGKTKHTLEVQEKLEADLSEKKGDGQGK